MQGQQYQFNCNFVFLMQQVRCVGPVNRFDGAYVSIHVKTFICQTVTFFIV